MRLWRVFGVATGQSSYPTPLGRFQIVVNVAQPVVVPAGVAVGGGREAVPPGPGNPLGTRWMGFSRSGRRHPRHA